MSPLEFFIIIIINIIIIIIIIELTHSKTILEITVEIEPQPAALDFKNQFFNQFLLSSPYSFDSTVYFDSVVQR